MPSRRAGSSFGVSDRTGALTALKQRLLAPPFVSLGYPLHVTIVHPRTSDRGPAAFAELESDPISGSVTVTELAWTETSPRRGMRVLRSVPARAAARAGGRGRAPPR